MALRTKEEDENRASSSIACTIRRFSEETAIADPSRWLPLGSTRREWSTLGNRMAFPKDAHTNIHA
jgi:hypothetical protein